jgi:2-iminobutanoate/2-iminopropanoate deaminase
MLGMAEVVPSMRMEAKTMKDRYGIFTDKAPKPSAAFSQAIVSGGFVFVAQVGRLPGGGVPGDNSIEAQTTQTLKNIQAILEEAGTDMAHVVKTTCYLTDAGLFKRFNAAYSEFFPDPPPSRCTLVVGLLADDLLIEIEAIARLPD